MKVISGTIRGYRVIEADGKIIFIKAGSVEVVPAK